jgi:hypothetical protein
VRELFFSNDPIVVTDLPLVVGEKGSRRELRVDVANAGSIVVTARGACDQLLAWEISLPREKELFCLIVDSDVSLVGMALPNFLGVQVLSLRGVLFLELSRDEDGTWTGSSMSREFFA